MRDTYRNRRLNELRKMAGEAFAAHEIREQHSDRHWNLMRRHRDGGWDSNMGCDIVVTGWRQIVVAGDIGPMVFAYGSGSPRETIGWMGRHDDLGYYVAQKAHIGMGDAPNEYDSDAAREDLDDLVAEYRESYDDGPDRVSRFAELIDDARYYVDDGEQRLTSFLYESCGEEFHNFLFDDWDGIGMVPRARLVYCHAAIKRLHELLASAETSVAAGGVL